MASRRKSIPGHSALTAAISHLGPVGSLRRQIAGNFAGSLALTLSSKLLMLLTSVLLARLLGASGFGVYSTAIAIALVLTVPAALGLPVLVLRLLPSYRVHEEWGLMRGLLTRSNQVVLGVSLLLAGVTSTVLWLSAADLGLENAAAFGLALVLIPLTALGALRSAALRGLHHVLLGQLPESIMMPALFLILVGSSWLLLGSGTTLSPQSAIGARVVAAALAFFVGVLLLSRHIPVSVRRAPPETDFSAWWRSALPLLFLNGMVVINMQADVLMLAALSGSESAGIYQASARGAEVVAFSLVIVNLAIQPTISRLFASGEMSRLQRVATLGARVATALALPLALLMVFLGKPLMQYVFGEEFAAGAVALALLAIAQVFNAVTGAAYDLLNMTGHERDSAVGMFIGATSNIAFNWMLIPTWDMAGAATATGVSVIIWNLWLVLKVRQRLGLAATALGPAGTNVP